jgi:uncharacterized protein involved in type VI secretion and phage assembly
MNADGRKRFYGRYLGLVATNVDPKRIGRLMVRVPDVLGNDSCIWADPATPLAGDNMGLSFVPPVNSGVWVEFQQGDPNYAIWTGGWRGSDSDVPDAAGKAPPTNPPVVLSSQSQNVIVISSTPGEGVLIETSAGANGPRIEITPSGIKLSTGKGATLELTGNAVNVNGSSLTVTG